MRRLTGLCLLLGCALLSPGVARAGGPIFVVVPGAGTPASLQQAVRRALAHDRRALTDCHQAERTQRRLLRRADAEALRAVDPFPAEDRATSLHVSLRRLSGRAQTLTHEIHGLQLAIQPLQLPARFSSEPASAIGAFAVSLAERYLGVRYQWGGDSPGSGFDCSGFVKYVYAQLGIQLPHYAASQYAETARVPLVQLEAGDLVFFEPRPDGPGHVGIYVGNGAFIEAPRTGDVVKFEQLSTEASLIGYVGAGRPAA
jgi:cell wall-associated NlpC family hydrolase